MSKKSALLGSILLFAQPVYAVPNPGCPSCGKKSDSFTTIEAGLILNVAGTVESAGGSCGGLAGSFSTSNVLASSICGFDYTGSNSAAAGNGLGACSSLFGPLGSSCNTPQLPNPAFSTFGCANGTATVNCGSFSLLTSVSSASNFGSFMWTDWPASVNCETPPQDFQGVALELSVPSAFATAVYPSGSLVTSLFVATNFSLSATQHECDGDGTPSATVTAAASGGFSRILFTVVNGPPVARDVLFSAEGRQYGPGIVGAANGFTVTPPLSPVSAVKSSVIFLPRRANPDPTMAPTTPITQVSLGAFDGKIGLSLGDLGYIVNADQNFSGVIDSVDYSIIAEYLFQNRVCIGDINGDGVVDGDDVLLFLNAYSIGSFVADLGSATASGDGIVDGEDFIEFINAFSTGC